MGAPMLKFQDMFQWDRFITPSIIKPAYLLVVGLVILFALSGIFSGLTAMAISPFGGFIVILSSLLGAIVAIVFARIMQHGRLAAPFNQLVGDSRHCGNDDSHIVAGIDLALDVPRHIADAVEVGDGCSAEFHHQSSHDSPGCAERR